MYIQNCWPRQIKVIQLLISILYLTSSFGAYAAEMREHHSKVRDKKPHGHINNVINLETMLNCSHQYTFIVILRMNGTELIFTQPTKSIISFYFASFWIIWEAIYSLFGFYASFMKGISSINIRDRAHMQKYSSDNQWIILAWLLLAKCLIANSRVWRKPMATSHWSTI